MILALTATEIEFETIQGTGRSDQDGTAFAITGVGLLETAVSATRLLEKHHRQTSCVVNFGIGGAYLSGDKQDVQVLDICLAEREVLGDYGVCFGDKTEPLSGDAAGQQTEYKLDGRLLDLAGRILADNRIPFHRGGFVTVNGASGTAARGAFLRSRYGAICENMEGAAIARVCREFGLPLFEIRVISNLVEDRPGAPWKIREASERAAYAALLIISGFQEIL